MPRNKLRDNLEGNELDLSLNNLTTVPVENLAAIPKGTHLDLSCNLISKLPDNFCTLTHLVKIDLSKNVLTELPVDFGALRNLEHLDLLGNQITVLPESIYKLQKLKWLDLKDNPLVEDLKKVAGDCLDEPQCKKCAQRVVEYMKRLHAEMERIRQRKQQEEREKEEAIKAAEEAIIEEKRRKRKEEKERKKLEKKEQAKQRHSQNPEKHEPVLTNESGNSIKAEPKKISKKNDSKFLLYSVLLAVFILPIAVCIGMHFFCNDYPIKTVCTEYWSPTVIRSSEILTGMLKSTSDFYKHFLTRCLLLKMIK